MKYPLYLTLLPLVLSGCGGSSSGGSSSSGAVPGLEMPDSMSVVTADSGGSGKLTFGKSSSKFSAQLSASFKNLTDPDTQFTTDPVHTYVYDASMESLDTVNMILCLMEQTRATDMLNRGAYIALVNEDKCEQGQNQSSSGSTGQSSGGTSTEFNNWTVLSTRASNTADQVVQIWVPGESGGANPMDSQTILVELTASEGVSASKPFGSFSMNFKGVVDAGNFGGQTGTEMEMMSGRLQTVDNTLSRPQFSFINAGGDALTGGSSANFSFLEAASVILDDASGTGGTALTERSESFFDGSSNQVQSSTFAIAFNSNFLLRGKDDDGDDTADSSICKSRSQYNTQVWQYNLYHSADGTFNGQAVEGGQRVELNSGFPFTYDSDNNGVGDVYGWVGYYGLWTGGANLSDGDSIVNFDYQTEAETSYTVNVAPGKMIRRSANTESLTGFQNDEFQFWGNHPVLNIPGQWIVTVDSNNDFQITGTMSWNDSGPIISSTIDHDNDTATAEVSAVATLPLVDNENVWLWSDSLGGNISYVHDSSIAGANRTVTFYGEEFVTVNDATLFPSGTNSLTLYCYERCLRGGLTQGDVDGAASESDLFYNYTGTPFQYTLTVSGGKVLLTDDTNAGAPVSAASLDLTAVGNDWGINTGEMLTAPLTNAAEPWAVFDEAVTYRWETGNNEWNQMVTVSDVNGNIASFDRPLQFSYTHSTANDANADSANNSKKFFLEYQGAGQLHGFPWVEDMETNRWYTAVTLADGTVLTDGTNNFAVKAIEMEQSMQTDNAGCTNLSIDSLYTDSTLDLPGLNNLAPVSITLAGKPIVTDAPAVIEGELQE